MVKRFAAILAVDIADFTHSMIHDKAVQRLVERFGKIYVPTVEEFGGRLFQTSGDGFLAEFASAMDAVGCAEALQDRNIQEDQSVDQRHRLHLRIGVSLGEIWVNGDNFGGTCVHIAGRLPELAGAGGICMTGLVREWIRNQTKRRISRRRP